MSTTSNKYAIKKRPSNSEKSIVNGDAHENEMSELELYYRNEIEKSYKNFSIIFQYLKNLSYYPEFEYSGYWI